MADRDDAKRNGHGGEIPADLPVYAAGQVAGEWDLSVGDAFWPQMEDLMGQSDLAAQLDAAMSGKSSPRVWLILHRPDEPQLGALVALAFARELGSREQAAIVLDCDDRQQSLTRWAGRLETDGWIDVARYGASVMTAGLPLPFAGRRSYLLGVGSFAPTEITGTEIAQMISRLRRQADDLILIAPADEVGLTWAAVAGIRLLCWDRAGCPAETVAAVAGTWAEAECPLTGLLGFGELPTVAGEMPPRVDDKAVAAGDATPPSPEVDESNAVSDFEAPQAAESAPGPDVRDETEEIPAAEDSRRGTSGVFWFVLTAAVVTVAILGVYWFQYVRVPGQIEQGSPPVTVRTEPVRPVPDRATGELANQDDAVEDIPAGVETDTLVAGSLDELTENASAAEEGPVVAAPEAGGAEIGDPVPGDGAGGTAEAETSAATGEPEEPAFAMAPYRELVGAQGWALHLYSVPSEASAEIEVAELQRRGFETAVRVLETQEKGRWWRVYVGSFASRAEAKAGARLLKEKLRTDWANPVRF